MLRSCSAVAPHRKKEYFFCAEQQKYFYGLHIQRIPYKTQDNKSKHELINEWSKIEAEIRSILKTLKELKNDESQKAYELTNKLMDLFKELSLIIKKYNESNNV